MLESFGAMHLINTAQCYIVPTYTFSLDSSNVQLSRTPQTVPRSSYLHSIHFWNSGAISNGVLHSQPEGWVTLGLGKALQRKLLRCSSETQTEKPVRTWSNLCMYRTRRGLNLCKISDVLPLFRVRHLVGKVVVFRSEEPQVPAITVWKVFYVSVQSCGILEMLSYPGMI